MSEQSMIDRSDYEREALPRPRMGYDETKCQQCGDVGLYLGALEERVDNEDSPMPVPIGWYPEYACDTCHIIWEGPVRKF